MKEDFRRGHINRHVQDILKLNTAASTLGVSDIPDCLKLTGDRKGVLLINYPMIFPGNPQENLSEKEKAKTTDLLLSLKRSLHFVVNEETPFKDKKDSFSVNNNMLSAFLDMVELGGYFPQLEVDMPEGIVGIKPGIFIPYTKDLGNGLTYLGKKYIVPKVEDLNGEVKISFSVKPPHSGKIYLHEISYKFM